MHSIIETLNVWGGRFLDFAPPLLWQSSLLMALVLGIDFFLRRKIRPAIRYLLWFVVFVKLLLPPTLALPTGAAWWLRGQKVQVVVPQAKTLTVSYREPAPVFVPAPARPTVRVTPPPPRLSRDAWLLIGATCISALLAAWSVFRWLQIARCIRGTTAATGELQDLLTETRRLAGLRKNVRLRLTSASMSPAVCGLLRPVVLLPQSLIERLTASQVRAVLLHELIHLRRRDVWVNCAQTLLQIVYWWHPLLWFANARVRRLREEAVDDAVIFALNEEAEIYAPTLLEVAKLAFHRPLATLGLVGILESRNALRHRIERLLNSSAPRRVGVSAVSVMCIAAFTALAVPMGEPPVRPLQGGDGSEGSSLIAFHAKINPEIFIHNVKARAAETMHTTNDAWSDILVSILDGFGVDCAPPRNITYDEEKGELSMQNTSEALTIVDEVVKELSLAGGERVLNPPHGLKQVLIEAQFYQLPRELISKFRLESISAHVDANSSTWWGLSAAQLANARQRLKELGVEPMSSPRIQTAHGMMASLFVGDGTNNIQLECVPFIHDDVVNLTALGRTTGKYAPGGKAWPDLAGHTNCAIFSRVSMNNGDGVALVAGNDGTENELIILLKAKILESAVRTIPKTTQSGPRVALTEANIVPNSEAQLAQDGKLLYQLGKLGEAEEKLQQVLKMSPNNQAALYYLSLIKQARIQSAVDGRNIVSGLQPRPTLYARTNTINTIPARQKLYEKLNKITFDKISYRNMSLADVVRDLTEQVEKRDPDQQGINFVLNRRQPATVALINGPYPTFDPTTGQPIVIPPATNADLDLTTVMVSLELKNVRLLDVLEAIVKSSDHPIKYSLMDYGIEFSLKGPDVVELHTRTFKLDPNTFYMGLQSIGALKTPSIAITNITSTNAAPNGKGLRYVRGYNDSTVDIQTAVITFFDKIGVKLTAPKSVFFNDRQGTLTVHATDEDLELIEQAINTLNTAPPEVTVKVRFVEAEPAFLATLLTNGPSTGTNAPWTGILTESRFKTILKALQKRENGDLLNEGEITTLSGRQANFQVVDIKTIVSGIDSTESIKGTNHNYKITDMPFGTTLDVVPTVAADGYSVQMILTPSVTEFLGYEDPKDYVKYDKNLEHVLLPLPKYRSRQMSTSAIVWDGQTLVLGNLRDESVVAEPNGAKLREPFNDKKKKQLIIFITPTIIDPSGNRIHSKDYYDTPSMSRGGGQ